MSVRVLAAVWDGYPGGGSELLTMLALADWSDDEGRCYPSIPAIARKIRLSPDQARRVVHRLIEGGFLQVVAGKNGGAGSRRYQIHLDRLTPCAHATPCMSARGGADASPPLAPMQGDPLHSYASRTVIDTSTTRQPDRDAKKTRRSGSPSASESADDGFAAFWDAYPKKVAKPAAEKAWRKLKPTGQLLADLMASLERQKGGEQWQKDGGQFIPHPATWLNGRRWEDDTQNSAIANEARNPIFAGAL